VRDEAASLARVGALLVPEVCAGWAERPLVVGAHPDDETLGASWLLAQAAAPRVVHVTDGAPRHPALRSPRAPPTREGYAELRHAEAVAALAHVGVPPERLLRLGAVDQEALDAVPGVARRLASLVEAERPTVVVTHPYEGGHPDHDATALAVHAALVLVARRGATPPPLLEMTAYHARRGALVTGDFLPGGEGPVATVVLDGAARARKAAMLACFASQAEVLCAFRVDVERLRRAPRSRFDAPPHPGALYYEAMGWAEGTRWRERAVAALVELGLTAQGLAAQRPLAAGPTAQGLAASGRTESGPWG
jgi:N-acetylglucosamine malate deacetylase 2